jgi:hypothetical protein
MPLFVICFVESYCKIPAYTVAQSLNIYSVKPHTYVLMANHSIYWWKTPLANLAEFLRHFDSKDLTPMAFLKDSLCSASLALNT